MKTVILEENCRMRVGDLPLPELEPDEVRIKVVSAGICSSDVPRAFEGGAHVYPLVMGHEMAGEVVICGAAATAEFALGDRVVVFPLLPCGRCGECQNKHYARCRSYDYYGSRRNGGFAQYLNVKSWNLLPLPNNLSFDDAALVEPVAVVVHALDRAGVLSSPGSSNSEIVIVGAGFLGLVAVQISHLLRPTTPVTLIDRNAYKLEIGAAAGAKTHLLASDADWQDFLNDSRSRFQVAIEATGVPDTFRRSVELACPGGRVMWMGNISAKLDLPQALVSSILRKELTILGTWNSSYDGRKPSDWTKVLDLMVQGFRPASLVTDFVGLDGLPGILERLYAHKQRIERHEILKAIVHPNKKD